MYVQDEGHCLALGLPGMISFYARQYSTSCADVASLRFFFLSPLLFNLQVGTGGRVERCGKSRAAWERGSFDPLSMGGRRRVLRSNWAGGPAFLVLCLDGYRGALVFPEPAKGKTKLGFDLRSKFRLARRIESNQIGVDQTGQKGPFLDPLSV